MKLEKCSNGHFYDSDKYSSCPHCESGSQMETVSVSSAPVIDSTVTLGHTQPVEQHIKAADIVQPAAFNDPDDIKTVGYFNIKSSKEKDDDIAVNPVVGWLVCVKGKHIGQDFRLKAGRNYIGRTEEMDVALTKEPSVSRSRHASIVYDPRGGLFIAQVGDSKELFYLNGKAVLSPTEIKKNDIISVGDVDLMFIPFCDDAYKWEKNITKENEE